MRFQDWQHMNKNMKQGLVPKLRFPEFNDAGKWKRLSGNKVFQQISNKSHNSDLPILAITQEYGAIPRELIDYNVSVTEKSIQSYKVIEVGDFVISLRSFQGGIEYSNYKGICSPAYVILRKKIELNEYFFKQYFKTTAFIRDLTKNLEGLRDGKMISYKQFSDVPLPFPHRGEQQKIADFLSSIDELITAHTEKLKALQSYKKGLMQNLFPVEGKTVPALRFPEFRDADEWQIIKLDKLGELVSGLTYSPKDVRGKGLLVLRSTNVQNGIVSLEDNVYVRPDIKGANLSRPNDILVCVRNGSKPLIGKNALIPEGLPLCTHGAFMTVFRAKNPRFVFQLFQTNTYTRQVAAGLGATINSINGNQFKKYEFCIPTSEEEKQKVAGCLSSIDDVIAAQAQKVEELKIHKKGLMQRLFPIMDEVGV